MISTGMIGRLKLSQKQIRKFSTVYNEVKRKVLDVEINCIETLGSSQNAPAIFFLPGAFGSIEMDFKPIIPQLNKEKYKWITWDPPGYGKSRPPTRDFMSKRYESVYISDVKYVKELMKILGHERYTLLAWSGAAHTGILLALEEPGKVSGLITWGAFAYVSKGTMAPGLLFLRLMGLSFIPEGRRAELIEMYGEKCLLDMWRGWCDETMRMAISKRFKRGGTFQEEIRSVQCPTLVMHGMRDKLINRSMAEYLVKTFQKSSLHIMENGTHNLHLRETKEFVQCVESFVDRTATVG